MKLADLLKEKRQQIQIGNGEFIKRLEPQVRELKESFHLSISGSFAGSLLAKLMPATYEEWIAGTPANEEVVSVYRDLKSKLGQEIHVGEWWQVTQSCIDEFAQVTGDDQWIHVDTGKAKAESPFKSTVAHGFLVLSLLPRLRGLESYATVHYPGARLVINCGLDHVRFLSPVKPGQSLRSRTLLRSVTANKRSLDLNEEVIIEVNSGRRRACTLTLSFKLYF